MSRLILIRHAQASFFAKDYDQLSPLGESQTRALAEHWLRMGVCFDEVIIGPRQRHARTAEIVRSAYHDRGLSWPDATVRPEFDEHDVARLLREPLEELLRLHPALEPLAAEYRQAMEPADTLRSFQRLFEAVCHLWCADAPGTETVERWSSFHDRVGTAMRQIMEQPGKNRTVGVFTSVGNITAALGHVLNCPPKQALELGWRVKNCSVTELIFSGHRITLDQFNNVSHLTDPGMWTFR